MQDLKKRVSDRKLALAAFTWRKTIAYAVLALASIGVWISMLASIAIAEMTRGELVLFRPSSAAILVATFLMLAGVVLLSIQIVSILNLLTQSDKH
ncbi:MAG: hypothetical protein HYX87_06405 [Chloroflexi bacterium]|nr:hypothetical protein [Chloroflexota bacterium]